MELTNWLAASFRLTASLGNLGSMEMTAGLLVGNVGPLGSISAKGRASVQGFWEYAAFVANSLIFLLIGIHEAQQPFALILPAIAAAIVFVLLGRALSVYPLSALFAGSRLRVRLRHQHVLYRRAKETATTPAAKWRQRRDTSRRW